MSLFSHHTFVPRRHSRPPLPLATMPVFLTQEPREDYAHAHRWKVVDEAAGIERCTRCASSRVAANDTAMAVLRHTVTVDRLLQPVPDLTPRGVG